TKNYPRAVQDILGHGATSQVYKAYNTTTGELVAAKFYQNSSNSRSPHGDGKANRNRDYQPVISVDSSSSINNRKALLIEYCNGESLHNVVQLPENRYGLLEDELMLVFKHLTNPLRYSHIKNT
ncbi:unnamed protein product, partial [Rotaria sp. Silwood2]